MGEISPEFKGHLEQDNAVSRLVSAIILLIVVLGVASAQLAAVLERRREFAVLSALGMRSRTLSRFSWKRRSSSASPARRSVWRSAFRSSGGWQRADRFEPYLGASYELSR